MSEKQRTLKFNGLLQGVRDETIEGNNFKVHAIASGDLGNFDAWLQESLVNDVSEDLWTDYGLPCEFTLEVSAQRNKLKVKLVEVTPETE